jgi:hypothetical protein
MNRLACMHRAVNTLAEYRVVDFGSYGCFYFLCFQRSCYFVVEASSRDEYPSNLRPPRLGHRRRPCCIDCCHCTSMCSNSTLLRPECPSSSHSTKRRYMLAAHRVPCLHCFAITSGSLCAMKQLGNLLNPLVFGVRTNTMHSGRLVAAAVGGGGTSDKAMGSPDWCEDIDKNFGSYRYLRHER